ncbi:MAG: HNH endonuclease, partial [Gammaproteobacteria bacterium]|nr:HNH endonuclease [Gammaproteobacteria bacterium]
MKMLTQEKVKELLDYNPQTGEFLWLKHYRVNRVGTIAGCVTARGYLCVDIDNKQYLLHRLAFLYMNGEFPPDHVDHINRDRSDNKWCNIKPSTHTENMQNKGNNNQVIGVYKHNNGWRAKSRQVDGLRKHLGVFKYYIQACAARF